MTRHWFGKPLKTLVGGIRLRLIGMIMLVVVPLVAARAIEFGQERFAQIDAAGAQAVEIAQRGAELYKEPIVAAQTLLEVGGRRGDGRAARPVARAWLHRGAGFPVRTCHPGRRGARLPGQAPAQDRQRGVTREA
jgi:hypothetical protein